jgi:hypothetical protein
MNVGIRDQSVIAEHGPDLLFGFRSFINRVEFVEPRARLWPFSKPPNPVSCLSRSLCPGPLKLEVGFGFRQFAFVQSLAPVRFLGSDSAAQSHW